MTKKTRTTDRSSTRIADTAATIAELWGRWARLVARYDAAADKNSQVALYDYGSAKILALCLASIRAKSVEDLRWRVEVIAWYRCQITDDSHILLLLEAALTEDQAALQPPLTREWH